MDFDKEMLESFINGSLVSKSGIVLDGQEEFDLRCGHVTCF